jgi:hypothetical protein
VGAGDGYGVTRDGARIGIDDESASGRVHARIVAQRGPAAKGCAGMRS